MRFVLNFADACGFDNYVVLVGMSITGGTGAETYTDPNEGRLRGSLTGPKTDGFVKAEGKSS